MANSKGYVNDILWQETAASPKGLAMASPIDNFFPTVTLFATLWGT